MRNFRDSFYDKSDIFIAFIIIAVAAVVIALRINAIMDYPSTIADTDSKAQTQTEEPADTTADDSKQNAGSADKDKDSQSTDSNKSDSSDKEDSSKDSDKDKKDTDKDSDKDKSKDKDSDKSSAEYVTIKITDLDSSADITSMLQSKGLISSASKFEQILKDNKLTTKLKSGTFRIKKGSSTKEIVKKLTGENI